MAAYAVNRRGVGSRRVDARGRVRETRVGLGGVGVRVVAREFVVGNGQVIGPPSSASSP